MDEQTDIETKDRISIIEKDMRNFTNELNECRLGCGLESYKKEMKERCERLSEKILNNKDQATSQKNQLEKDIDNSEITIMGKVNGLRLLLSRLFTAILIISVFYGGILGTIQIQKVSQAEFNNHLRDYAADQAKDGERFNAMIHTFELNRKERDNKIDSLLEKQLDFNERVLHQNALLEKQIEVIKTRLDMNNQ